MLKRGDKVRWFEMEMQPATDDKRAAYQPSKWVKVCRGEAVFIKWGLDCCESDGGNASFTAALVEKPDGFIEVVQPDCIQKIKRRK